MAEIKSYACSGCGVTHASKRLPPKWKNMPAGPLCPACRDGYATRVISIPVREVVEPAGTSLLDSLRAAWRLSTDLANFAKVNEVMAKYISEPYPARAAVGVASLPRGARVEIEAILHLG